MKYILSFDQGTTSSRAVLVGPDGSIKAKSQKEFKQIFPASGWVEHDPNEIWSSQISVASEVLAHSGVAARDVCAIGITNQRETTILWDKKTGQPLFNAIVWQDRRTTEYCQKLKSEGYEPLFRKKTGLLLDPYFSGTKIKWILDHVPGSYERARRGEIAFGTVDSWLLWKLTEGRLHVTDATNASRTLLYNLFTGDWDEELLQILNIPKEILPKICHSSEVYGETSTSIFSSPIALAGIAGDQQAALFGQACHKKGMVKNTYGTGCFMLMHTGEKPVLSNNLLTTVAYRLKDKTAFALEGSVFIAGAVVQWLRDNLGIIKSSAEIEKLALSVPDTGGVYFVPAFTGLGAPHWNPYMRGALLGLSRGSTAAHIARAALESIAYQVADVIKCMEADAGFSVAELRVDGGAVANNLLMQFQADLLQAPVIRPKVAELTALGAAYLAGLAVGFWGSMEEISSYWQVDHSFEPTRSEKMPKQYAKWKHAVETAANWEEKKNE